MAPSEIMNLVQVSLGVLNSALESLNKVSQLLKNDEVSAGQTPPQKATANNGYHVLTPTHTLKPKEAEKPVMYTAGSHKLGKPSKLGIFSLHKENQIDKEYKKENQALKELEEARRQRHGSSYGR